LKTIFKQKSNRTDNGVEFVMKDFFTSKGILHQTSCIETLEQNRIVERKHQHILNVTSFLLFQSKILATFYNFVVQHVVSLINYIPSPLLNNATPYEKMQTKLCDILTCVSLVVCVIFYSCCS